MKTGSLTRTASFLTALLFDGSVTPSPKIGPRNAEQIYFFCLWWSLHELLPRTMCLLLPEVPGKDCGAKGCSDKPHGDGGDNSDVIASDKLPFLTTPEPDSWMLPMHWVYEANKHICFGVEFKYKPEGFHFPFWVFQGLYWEITEESFMRD